MGWVGRNKTVFLEDIIFCIENPKEFLFLKNLVELISELSKIKGCEVNIQKLIAFLYSNKNG